ncbi:MAG TPA: hypothetical protein VGM91_01655 [Conexibacter sp.]|jgi:hypothetical protein
MSGEFIAAYAGSSVAQAALVAGATAGSAPVWIRSLRHRVFAIIPMLSLVGVVILLRIHPDQASVIARIALVLVPIGALLAALRIGWPAVIVTFAAIGAVLYDSTSLTGQLAAFFLIGGSCLLLGSLLVELTPPNWLGIGIVAMAVSDLILVATGVLGPAANALNMAAVGGHLPQLQRVEIGPLDMGYGDVFLPALVGALLAARARPRGWATGLTLLFALAAGLVFLAFDRLPATVPVAGALLVVEGASALRGAWLRRRGGDAVPGDATPAAADAPATAGAADGAAGRGVAVPAALAAAADAPRAIAGACRGLVKPDLPAAASPGRPAAARPTSVAAPATAHAAAPER